MLRLLLIVLFVGGAVAAGVWAMRRAQGPRQLPHPRSPAAIPTIAGNAERSTLAYGPERGPGTLRLTASQLIFEADSGRVLVVERLDIVGVGTSRQLPDRTLAQEVLVVTTTHETYFWAVGDPGEWVNSLT